MKIEVTDDDIRQGTKGNCVRCPVALAIERALGKDLAFEPWVVGDAAWVGLRRCTLPRKARNWIRRFDRELSVAPFTFDLDI